MTLNLWKVENVDVILLLVIVIYVIVCPYTKVEESFNMQALHDLHHFSFFQQLKAFDHLQFPGVVPRTFIGSLVLYGFGYPIYSIGSFFFHLYHTFLYGDDNFGIITYEGIYTQIFYRSVLGFFSWLSIVHFKQSLLHVFPKSYERIGELFSISLLLQFHINFYASRTLPNIFAFILVMHAFALWFSKQPLSCILIIGFAMTVIRCDMLVLLAPTVLVMLLTSEIYFFKSLLSGVLICSLSIGLSVAIDSYFWQRWLWPEGTVLYFNTAENKSSEWGVMPFHWYFTNALLKSLNLLWVWIIAGFIGVSFCPNSSSNYWNIFANIQFFHYSKNRVKALYYLTPVLSFVILYSFLPHKELRFIFPAIPMFTLFAAVALNELLPCRSTDLWFPLSLLSNDNNNENDYNQKVKKSKKNDDDKTSNVESSLSKKSVYHHLISFAAIASFLIMFLLANLFLMASYHNYPGGFALDRLIEQHVGLQISLIDSNLSLITRPIFIHIDVLAATSGVTRFVQPRLLFQATTSYNLPELDYLYLNSSPDEWDNYMNRLLSPKNESSQQISSQNMINHNWVNIGKDLVYYSKDEGLIDYSSFDWLITENITMVQRNPNKFAVVEKILGFDRFQFSLKNGVRLHLKPILYLVRNQRVVDVDEG